MKARIYYINLKLSLCIFYCHLKFMQFYVIKRLLNCLPYLKFPKLHFKVNFQDFQDFLVFFRAKKIGLTIFILLKLTRIILFFYLLKLFYYFIFLQIVQINFQLIINSSLIFYFHYLLKVELNANPL